MPTVGDVARGRDFPEKPASAASQRFIYAQCPGCGLERWVHYNSLLVTSKRQCSPCSIAANGRGFKVGKSMYEGINES